MLAVLWPDLPTRPRRAAYHLPMALATPSTPLRPRPRWQRALWGGAGALALGRSRQVNKKGWARKRAAVKSPGKGH